MRTTTLVLFGVVVAAFLVPVLIGLSRGIAFGYDEALYAQATRHWATLGDAPISGWGVHRPPALPIIGVPFAIAGSGDEWVLRLTGVASGIAIVAAAGLAGTMLAGGTGGVIAAAATAAAAPIQVEAASYLTDLPSTAILLVLAVLCLRVLWAPRARWQDFALLAALAVLAFYLRYGAALAVVALLVAAFATRRRAMLTKEALAGAVVGAALLVPHAVGSTLATGSPFGILAAAQRAAATDGGPPLLDYLRWLRLDLVGPMGAAVAVLGAAIAVLLVARPRFVEEPFRSRGIFLGVTAAVSLLLTGLSVHAEPRYVVFPMVTLITVGSATLARAVAETTHRSRILPALAVVLAVAAIWGGLRTVAVIDDRDLRWDWLRAIGRDIDHDAGSEPCSVLTSDAPVIAWYSGCAAVNYLTGDEPDRLALLGGSHRYVVVRADGHLQPDEAATRALLAGAEPWRTYRDGFGNEVAEVYRVTR